MKRAELASAQREKKKSVTQKKSEAFFAASWNWLYNNSTTSTREKNEKVKQFENLKSTRVASSTAHNIAQRRHTSEINWNSNSTSYWIVVMGSEWEKSEREREKEKKLRWHWKLHSCTEVFFPLLSFSLPPQRCRHPPRGRKKNVIDLFLRIFTQ